MSPCFVEVTDANGDRVTTIGPFQDRANAVAYYHAHQSRKGEWYLDVVEAKISPDKLDWQPGESVYQALERAK